MPVLRLLLITLLLALQGIAPLLHAHVREQGGNGQGIHMVGLGEVGELATAPHGSVRGDEAPFVEPGDAWRRGPLNPPDAAGPRRLPPVVAVEWHAPAGLAAATRLPGCTTARTPEARAPPVPSA